VVVARADNHFRCQVLWGAAEGVGIFLFVDVQNLGKPEVGQHDVTVLVKQDVLGLEISVDDLRVM